jgi:hypothetical protein
MAVRLSALRVGHPYPQEDSRGGVEIGRKHGIAAIQLFGHVVVVVVVFFLVFIYSVLPLLLLY